MVMIQQVLFLGMITIMYVAITLPHSVDGFTHSTHFSMPPLSVKKDVINNVNKGLHHLAPKGCSPLHQQCLYSTTPSSRTTSSTTRRRSNNYIPRHSCIRSSSSILLAANNSQQEAKEGSSHSPSCLATLTSTVGLIALDISFRKLFKAFSISFPSSLGGCGAVFATMVGLYSFRPSLGDSVYNLLSPGAAILAKWLPVFFVPSLITLPLAAALGTSMEIVKVAMVILGGFYFTLFSTAFSVLGIRKFVTTSSSSSLSSSSSSLASTTAASVPTTTTPTATTTTITPVATKAFSDGTYSGLVTVALASMVCAGVALKSNLLLPSIVTTPLQATAFLFTTLAAFTFGARLPKSFTKKVHPLITCTTLTWAVMAMFAKMTGQTFTSVLSSYKVGSMCPVHLGAGDILLFMLGPAVVALACQMYDRKKLMKENLWEVGTAVGVSSVGGLFGTAAMVRLLGISSLTLRLCCLSRNITSPLAMAIASILGADVSLAVSMVVVTGLLGANFGAAILDWAGIKDAVARGMGIGAAAHGLGTAAFAHEKDAFPFAAISMALTASACTTLVSIPVVKRLVISLALGASS
eukprot:CAMPEP_0176504902 /NCGR_PEP_ID=MMETSP0200_2-20121128/16200_1 /TAXON_ID=947934 /ORGANISM="Chaetoceros sp., Strain GSL56" /LENGTH=579 /DNA_ID=CAMNT_0017904403 /DNA_START=124 /DNA_END=1862 /DNA_ORIENTATION=+